MNWGMDFWSVFSMVFLITAIPVAIMIIMEKRSPYKTAAWILVLILLPIFGVIFYLFFGQEYRKQKLFSRKGLKSHSQFRKLSMKQLRQFKKAFSNLDEKILEKENLIRLLLNNSNSLLTTGNEVKLLESPAQTFGAIFEAIKKARHHIHLEYYIFANDKIGNQMKNLLMEKARQGVQVRVIIDDVGSWGLRKKILEEIKNSGIEIFSFMEVRFPRLTSKVNYRNHRKIIVIDGKTGFTGGVNIADRYLEGVKGIGPWKDIHIQFEGDAAACLQVIFAADWYFVSRQNLTGEKYFPVMRDGEGVAMQISASGPDSDWENIGQAFFAAIANAKRRVYIVSPYLMPPLQIVSALKTASLSNVDVRIIIPEKSDSPIPMWSSFSYVGELLEAGVKIYFYNTGFIHSKYIVVDDVFTTVGTTNLDFRSIETNFEVNAFIYNESFTTQMVKVFRKDMQNSREIKLKDWKQRPWQFKLRESFAHTVSPML